MPIDPRPQIRPKALRLRLPHPRHFLIEHLPIDERTVGADTVIRVVSFIVCDRPESKQLVALFAVIAQNLTVLHYKACAMLGVPASAMPQQPQPRRRFDVRSAGDSSTVFGAHDSLQSTGAQPGLLSVKAKLARLNGRAPKKPLSADRGDGWAL